MKRKLLEEKRPVSFLKENMTKMQHFCETWVEHLPEHWSFYFLLNTKGFAKELLSEWSWEQLQQTFSGEPFTEAQNMYKSLPYQSSPFKQIVREFDQLQEAEMRTYLKNGTIPPLVYLPLLCDVRDLCKNQTIVDRWKEDHQTTDILWHLEQDIDQLKVCAFPRNDALEWKLLGTFFTTWYRITQEYPHFVTLIGTLFPEHCFGRELSEHI